MPIRVLLADDHGIVRDGLRAVLSAERDFLVVAEEADGAAALAAIERLAPDVAVLDVQMPGLTGIEVARKLKDKSRTSVVLLSMHREESFVQAALLAGARGYVVKEDAARELTDAIRAVARGDTYLSPRVAGFVVGALRSAQAGGPAAQEPQLTPRERDVVRLLAEGLTSKEIAQKLEMAPKTVDGHRSAIMEKLGIHSVAGLVKYALRHHLADLGS
jgi:DNA-binding NarL/FixJ family response regulator